MISVMLPPWWNVCGAQYRNETSGESMPRTMSTAVSPSSTKSSGCGSRRRLTLFPPKTGRQPPAHAPRGHPAFDEVVRVRLEPQLDAFPLEDRQQLLHRPPELGLAPGGL